MGIAGLAHALAFGGRELVRGHVATAFIAKSERTVIRHEMVGEKFFRGGEAGGKEFPEAAAADLRARAGQPGDGTLGMGGGGLTGGRGDAEPVAHGGDFAKGNPRLDHAERPGVHAQKHDALGRTAEAGEVFFMRRPGVVERVVNMGHGRPETEPAHAVGEFLRGGDERADGGGRLQSGIRIGDAHEKDELDNR